MHDQCVTQRTFTARHSCPMVLGMTEISDSPTYDSVREDLGIDPAEIDREPWTFEAADARARAHLETQHE